MSLANQVQNFIKQASLTASYSNNLADSVRLTAVFITPVKQITAISVTKFTEIADFITERTEWVGLRVKLQPSVYYDEIVPYRDQLTVQVIIDSGDERIIREFVGNPMADQDLRAQGNNSTNANLAQQDNIVIEEHEFQLMNKTYAVLRNQQASDNYLMAQVGPTMEMMMEEYSKQRAEMMAVPYKGMYVHKPFDNLKSLRQVSIPQGTRLVDIPSFLQNHPEYGIYSKGLGSFFKQGYWWVYPLFNVNLVDQHHRPIDIIRVPEDKMPTLDVTFYKSDVALTIISTGKATHNDRADVRKQNTGVGKRIIMGDAIAGDTGYHYEKGRALTTRADKLQEYKLSERGDDNEFVPLDREPSANMCASMTQNAINEGEFLALSWHNGDTGYLEPGHPIRYQYMGPDDTMVTRKGVLHGYRTDYIPITDEVRPAMKRSCTLHIFLKRQDAYKLEE